MRLTTLQERAVLDEEPRALAFGLEELRKVGFPDLDEYARYADAALAS